MEAVLLGAGGRGLYTEGAFAQKHPDLLKYVAIAEPNEERRKMFAKIHHIPEDRQFKSYKDLFDRSERLAPICFNTTMDLEHLDSSLMALKHGYNLFLEKPIDVTAKGVLEIFDTVKKHKSIVQICHPLRYTPFYLSIKSLIDREVIGKIISIKMEENVSYWHFAHSFVRGNWGNVKKCGPVILTKTCHDMDIAVWLASAMPDTVMSMASQSMFIAKNKPEGAPDRCLDKCPYLGKCPFDAKKMYLGKRTEWPVNAISLSSSLKARREAIEKGPYGRCVFACDNTAMDEQNVLVRFKNGITLNFAMHANTMHSKRTIRILGTEGEINGHLENNDLNYVRFSPGRGETSKIKTINPEMRIKEDDGHHGGDGGTMRNFLAMVKANDFKTSLASLKIAVDSHMLSFAAEEAQKSKQPVKMDKFIKSIK